MASSIGAIPAALEGATFSIGIRGAHSLLHRPIQPTKKVKVVCTTFPSPTFTFSLTRSYFTIFPYPDTTTPAVKEAVVVLRRAADSQALLDYYMQCSKVSPFGKQIRIPLKTTPLSLWSPSFTEELSRCIHRVRRNKAVLQRFLHQWRSKRLIVRNTEDVVTLGSITNPIHVVDWSGRHLYQFQADSIMRDITARLLNHDGLFDFAQVPRNALTNEPLTLSQQISVWLQLDRSRTKGSWPFAALRACRWDIHRFQDEYGIPLRLYSLRKTMQDIHHIDTREALTYFIEMIHNYVGSIYQEQRYLRMIDSYEPRKHKRLRTLLKLCMQYNEIGILYSTNIARLAIEEQRIIQEARRSIYT